MEHITCIFCNQPSPTTAIKENGFEGKQCTRCPLIYISPRPPRAAVLDIYGHNDAHISAASHVQGDFLKRLYAKHAISIIKKYKKTGSILEIGSGGGYFLDEARKAGFQPYAIELNPLQADFITKHLHIACEQRPLSAESFDTMKFDIIYHCDVISHFHDPVAEFRIMYEKLVPGGMIVFETGNIADIHPEYYSLFSCFQYPDHLFFFWRKEPGVFARSYRIPNP